MSKNLNSMKVSIQGIKGAFHEEAARNYFNHNISPLENLSFDGVISSVENNIADAGIMAIENSISGTIHTNYELIKNSDLNIVGETYLRISQNLAVSKGVQLKDLVQVESHYMAINQCRNYFSNQPQIRLVDMEDTALSMKNIADQQLMNTGAIGSKLAAQYYNLDIIGESIETNKQNYTRFLILQKNPKEVPAPNKSSVQMILNHQRGALAKVLSIINDCEINLSKIESMPIVGEPWHYQFYLDVEYKHPEAYHKMIKKVAPHIESISALGHYHTSK